MSPYRSQLLRVTYPEEQLPREKLLLALVNEDTNKVLLRATLPLAPLTPGALLPASAPCSSRAPACCCLLAAWPFPACCKSKRAVRI